MVVCENILLAITHAMGWCTQYVRAVPKTPDPNASAKVSRYEWEAYRDILKVILIILEFVFNL